MNLKSVIEERCVLGEGLFTKNHVHYWVDIQKNCVYRFKKNNLETFKVSYKPSVIFDEKDGEVLIGSDIGVVSQRLENDEFRIINKLPEDHNFDKYRSNDGGFCDNSILLGFMDRNNPGDNAGLIYAISDNEMILIDDSIHIPNSFIEIEPGKILISDSYKNQIWLFELDSQTNFFNKTLWKQLDSHIVPDGGCKINDYVLICLWDGAEVAVFDLQARLLSSLPLKCLRPTNCKFSSETSQLIITSASEGLSAEQMRKFPHSGYIFVYNLVF